MIKKIAVYFIFWRIFLFVPLLFGLLFLVTREGYRLLPQAFYSWANFDGVRYLAIAQRGYISEGAFFPLYPLLIKLVSFWSSNIYVLYWAGLIISNISFVLGLLFFYKLLLVDYSDRVSRFTIIALLVFPTAFFFGVVYSESMFFLLLILSFYYARSNKWIVATIFAFLLCATRLVGIFIIPALVVEYWLQKKDLRRVWLLVIPALSAIIYAIYNYFKWGDWLFFLHAHGQLGNSRSTDRIILFPQTVYRYLKILADLPVSQYEWWIALLEATMFVLVFWLLILAWKNKMRLSYLTFAWLAFLLPALSGTFSGLPRYVLLAFPIFVVLANIKTKTARTTYIVASVILQFILVMYFTRGYFVA